MVAPFDEAEEIAREEREDRERLEAWCKRHPSRRVRYGVTLSEGEHQRLFYADTPEESLHDAATWVRDTGDH